MIETGVVVGYVLLGVGILGVIWLHTRYCWWRGYRTAYREMLVAFGEGYEEEVSNDAA